MANEKTSTADARWKQHPPIHTQLPIAVPDGCTLTELILHCAVCRTLIEDGRVHGQLENVGWAIRARMVGKCPDCPKFTWGLVWVMPYEGGLFMFGPKKVPATDPWRD